MSDGFAARMKRFRLDGSRLVKKFQLRVFICNKSDKTDCVAQKFWVENIGYYRYVPEFAAGRQRLFPWDGSLRSALFPRKESLAACLQQCICEE